MNGDDVRFMKQALELAEKGLGWTSPNPMVGAVVCKDGEIISTGWHPRCGEAHAERIALEQAGGKARGATLYVTLEPCSHHGRTPPCLDITLSSGVQRVVIGMSDPNPLVNGKSIQALRENGVEVEVGVCEKEARLLNLPFISNIQRSRPWVTLKYAMTLDGRIAAASGDSKWISGKASRQKVHAIRQKNRAILVGYRTALLDNPMLNCRLESEFPVRQPLRIVLGGVSGLSNASQIAKTAHEIPSLHVVSARRFRGTLREPDGVEGIILSSEKPVLQELMELLHAREIDSLMVEGGAQTIAGFWDADLIDEVYAFVAPKVLCDSDAIAPFAGSRTCESMEDARALKDVTIRQLGEDALIHGYAHEMFLPSSPAPLMRGEE